MTLWHVEPIVEDIQSIEKHDKYFDRLDTITRTYLGLSLGDLEMLSVPRISLFLHDHYGLDLSKCLIAYLIFEKLVEFEQNMFVAALYRRKMSDVYDMIQDIARNHGVSLEAYLAS